VYKVSYAKKLNTAQY